MGKIAWLGTFIPKDFMSHCSSLNRMLGGILFLALFVTPAAAHKVEVSEDVAGTWHIEPNHNPKAGEPARAWVILTRKGGQILPLEEGNCQLAVYSVPRTPSDLPLLQPTIKAVSAERYQGIPGADIVFPNIGIYQLELSCTPKAEGSFKPFQMKYEVSVAASAVPPAPRGTETSPPSRESAQSQGTTASPTTQEDSRQSARGWSVLAIAIAVVLGIGTLGIVARRATRKH